MPANDKSTQDYFGHAIILSDTHINIMTFINILARTTPTFLGKEDAENRIRDKELSTQE